MNLLLFSSAVEKIATFQALSAKSLDTSAIGSEIKEVIGYLAEVDLEGVDLKRICLDTSIPDTAILDKVKRVFSKHVFIESFKGILDCNEALSLFEICAPLYDQIIKPLDRSIFLDLLKKIPSAKRMIFLKKLVHTLVYDSKLIEKFLFLACDHPVNCIEKILDLLYKFCGTSSRDITPILHVLPKNSVFEFLGMLEYVHPLTLNCKDLNSIDILASLVCSFPDSCRKLLCKVVADLTIALDTISDINSIAKRSLDIIRKDRGDVLLHAVDLNDASYTCQERLDILDYFTNISESEAQHLCVLALPIALKTTNAIQRLSILTAIQNVPHKDKKETCSLVWEIIQLVDDSFGVEKLICHLAQHSSQNRQEFFSQAKPFLIKLFENEPLNYILRPSKITHFFSVYSLLPIKNRNEVYRAMQPSLVGLSLKDKNTLALIAAGLSFYPTMMLVDILEKSDSVTARKKKIELLQFLFFIPSPIVIPFLVGLKGMEARQSLQNIDSLYFLEYMFTQCPGYRQDVKIYLLGQLQTVSDKFFARYLAEYVINYKNVFGIDPHDQLHNIAKKVVEFSYRSHEAINPYRIFESLQLRATQKISFEDSSLLCEIIDDIVTNLSQKIFSFSVNQYVFSSEVESYLHKDLLLSCYKCIERKLEQPINRRVIESQGISYEILLESIKEKTLSNIWLGSSQRVMSKEQACLHRIVAHAVEIQNTNPSDCVLTTLELQIMNLHLLSLSGIEQFKKDVLDVYYTLPVSCKLHLGQDKPKGPQWHAIRDFVSEVLDEYIELDILTSMAFFMDLTGLSLQELLLHKDLYIKYIKNLVYPHLKKNYKVLFDFDFSLLNTKILNYSAEDIINKIFESMSIYELIAHIQDSFECFGVQKKQHLISCIDNLIFTRDDLMDVYILNEESSPLGLKPYGVIKMLSFFELVSYLPSELNKINRLSYLIQLSHPSGINLSSVSFLESSILNSIIKHYHGLLIRLRSVGFSLNDATQEFSNPDADLDTKCKLFAVCKTMSELYSKLIGEISLKNFNLHFDAMNPFFKKLVYSCSASLLHVDPLHNISMGADSFWGESKEIEEFRDSVFLEVLKLTPNQFLLLIAPCQDERIEVV
ncbi:MAG: hypothetical protein FJZ57_05485 [Chlamydiae bacterium]|nr:hypothetical protein [Chlamydiota bacterium]